MYNIAIIEDDRQAMNLLEEYLLRFGKEHSEEFNIVKFSGTIPFLNNYTGNYDIVFMDIELPDMNGMEAAKKLREVDKRVVLIFVTNLAQFAVEGYEVNALDFIVKPVDYSFLSLKLKRALDYAKNNRGVKIFVSTEDGLIGLSSEDIRYIEIMSHNIVFHTLHGDFKTYGTLKKIERQLEGANFVRCNSCYLVNLRYVTSVKGFTAYIGEDPLQISHPKKQSFMFALTDYLGGGGTVDV